MPLIWTHTSIAKSPALSFERSASVWGTTLQIFAKSPRGRAIPTYTDEQMAQLEQWKALREQYGQTWGIIHSNYLANLAKPQDELEKEIPSILHDFWLADMLWYEAINVHIWKEKGRASQQEAMQHMAKNVEQLLTDVQQAWHGHIQYLFENTAWQGSEIGSSIDEIAALAQMLWDMPVKYCLDTAHCRWGGIDLTHRDLVLEERDEKVWIDKLYAIHLNDAKVPLWSRVDRHASLGHGFVWRKTLVPIIQRADDMWRAMYIETPEPDLRPEEIASVKQICAGDVWRIDSAHKDVFCTQYLKKYAKHVQERKW